MHSSIIATLSSFEHALMIFAKSGTINFDVKNNEIYYSFLPMAHIYARVMEAFVLFIGCEIAF